MEFAEKVARYPFVVVEENGHVTSWHRTEAAAVRAYERGQAEVQRRGYSWHPCRVQKSSSLA